MISIRSHDDDYVTIEVMTMTMTMTMTTMMTTMEANLKVEIPVESNEIIQLVPTLNGS
ncbi:hypothetical protein OK016_29220 [Vibrio chagasii]|nr:hypothetical protein [Vibrio chagasii]